MAAIMHRGRHSSRRSRGRHDSSDSDVPLDLSIEPEKNVTEILLNIVKTVGISRGRKLGHLNNFVKILRHVNEDTHLGFHLPELICCLRLSLLHDAKEVRAGGLRAFRYLLRSEETLSVMLKFHIDVLVARCLDIYQSNEIERVQALRFMRKIITLCPSTFPQSLAKAIIAIGNDGGHERDRLLRACMETLCELALKNIELVSQCGGISTILHNILDNPLPRMNESLVFTILYLLNQPHTRKYIRANVDLEKILAPYTDIHYRHTYHMPESQTQLSEDRECRWIASRMAIVSMFRSWPGIIRLCRPDASGLLSFLGVLCIPNEEIRKSIMDVFFDIFRLPIPVWTNDFNVSLLSSDPSQMQSSWKLSAGFVCEEAKAILPHRAMTRSNLVENHLALVLQAFICAGLLESLVEVITSGEAHIAIRTTLLLGELLHMANTLLPHECGHHSHCLPTLMTLAASFDIPTIERVRASAAVSRLSRYHEMKKRGPVPCSLFLDQILKYSKAYETDSAKNDKMVKEKLFHATYKDSDDPISQALKDTKVLTTKANFEWDWDLITAVLKWPGSSLRRLEDTVNTRFIRRVTHFFKPSNNLYCSIDITKSESRKYSVAGIQLVDFLLSCEEEGEKLLIELVQELVDRLVEVIGGLATSSSIFSFMKVTSTLSQHYFLMIGKMTSSAQGEKVLEKTGLFQYLLDLCTLPSQEHLTKLVITSLDYSRNSLSRIILSKVLSSSPESVQLYATSHMRVLLRAKAPFFSSWGMELLVTQLYDKSREVAMEAIDIIDEACEVEANLHALVQMRPSLLHMGDKGVLLLIRFLSIPKGFKCLADVNFVTHELEKWKKTFNHKYVTIVESELNEAFTTYQRPTNDVHFMRRSSEEQTTKKDVFVPVHLYGQLAQHKAGADLLDKQDIVPELSRCIRYPETTPDKIAALKAALWGLGHIGSSTWGLKLLAQEEILPDIIRLAEECEVFSVRGTCFYVLGLIAKTRHGAEMLSRLGWESTRHSREEIWPVVEEKDVLLDETGNLLHDFPSSSSLQSMNSRTDMETPHYYVPGDGQYGSFISIGDKMPDSSSPSSTFFLDINEKLEHVAAKASDRTPSPVVAGASPKKERTSFSMPYGDMDVRNRGSSGMGVKKLIAGPKDREGDLTPGRQRRRMTPSPEGKMVTVSDSPIIETKRRSNSDSRTLTNDSDKAGKLRSNRSFELKYNTLPKQRSQSFKYRSNSTESSGRGSMDTKSRSDSFADTVTSGVSSLSSTQSSPPMDSAHTDSVSSISTINSSQTVKVVHSSDSARKQVNLKRTPSFTRHFSSHKSATLPTGSHLSGRSSVVEAHATFTTTRDAQGLAALKSLKRQRADSISDKGERLSLSGFPFGTSPGSLGRSNTYSGRLTSLGEGSQTSLESSDSMKKTRSLPRSHHTTSPGGGDYIGLCLPVDVTMIFQVDDPPRKQSPIGFQRQGETLKMLSPVSEKSLTSSIDALVVPSASLTHFSLTNAAEALHQQVRERKISRMESGFEVHQSEICLLCTKFRREGIRVTVEDYSGDIGRLRVLSEGDDGAASDTGCEYSTGTTPQFSLLRSTSAGKSPSGIEVTTSSSISSGESTPALKKLTEDSPLGRSLIKKEVLRLVVNLSSSVAMKAQEQGLLNLKERFPDAFQDICLYSDVADLLGTYSFRLSARRFIQELFQDMTFAELYIEARAILQLAEIETTPPGDNDF
ncbi:rapamycin-insensitive companion of mTOR-like isoform X2 [Ptychodera flava]|uniref:rapamycin-insensitive companion of mTOR-like isoform X2 n=1 Tax=Ptychodera flava TaxID=63121 RepID=UPI00396A3C02